MTAGIKNQWYPRKFHDSEQWNKRVMLAAHIPKKHDRITQDDDPAADQSEQTWQNPAYQIGGLHCARYLTKKAQLPDETKQRVCTQYKRDKEKTPNRQSDPRVNRCDLLSCFNHQAA
jgi:hypothetical protein